MPGKRKCPVCGNWRWREEDRPDSEGHHPDCGVNVRRTRQAGESARRWRERRDASEREL